MLNLTRAAFAVLLVCAFAPTVATLPGRVDVDELFDISEQVLLLRIVAGRLNSLEDDCGARYVAQVERSWKGVPVGSTVEFNFGDPSLGESYLVYLVAHSNPKADSWASTNSRDASARTAWYRKCSDKLASFRIARNAIFKIWQSGRGAESRGPLFPISSFLIMPKDLRATRNDRIWHSTLDEFDAYIERRRQLK